MAIILLVGIMLSLPATGQTTKTFEVSLGGGMGFLTAPQIFKDYSKTGFVASGEIGFYLTQAVVLNAGAWYLNMPLNESQISSDAAFPAGYTVTGIDNYHMRTIDIYGGVKIVLLPSSKGISPFVKACIGWGKFIASSIDVYATSSRGIPTTRTLMMSGGVGTTAYALGAGVSIPLGGKFSIPVEARFTNIATDPSPVTSFCLRAGVTLTL
jgi:hypothetical protein